MILQHWSCGCAKGFEFDSDRKKLFKWSPPPLQIHWRQGFWFWFWQKKLYVRKKKVRVKLIRIFEYNPKCVVLIIIKAMICNPCAHHVLNQDEVETSHRLYIRQQIMNKRAEKMFYFVISKSSLNQDEVETSHRLYTRLGYDKYDF